jgi:hypothetical protein
MDVNLLRASFYRSEDVKVVVPIKRGMNATLKTDFGGALVFCFGDTPCDFFEVKQVGITPQV